MSPKDRWEKLEKGRICFSCLEPRGTCANHSKVPKDLKCVQCALWGEPKILALFRIFCKRKEHGESRASPSEIKGALEKYIGKLASGIVKADILFAVIFMFRANATVEELGN